MENPVTVRKELLPKAKDTELLNSKEETIRKAPLNNIITIKKALLESPIIKLNLRDLSSTNTAPIPSARTILPQRQSDKHRSIMSCVKLLKSTTLCPFKYSRGLFKCLYCNVSFLDIHQVEDHVKQHESISEDDIYKILEKQSRYNYIKLNIKEFGCKICDHVAEDWSTLKQHLAEKHDYETDSENDRVKLFKINKNNFDCALCDKKFVKYNLLNFHVKEHYTKFFCDQCGKGFISPSGLKEHMVTHEIGSYPCAVCGKVFKNKPGKDDHYKSVHDKPKKSYCNICREGFSDYSQKLKHMKYVHNADLPEYKCSYCPKVFITNSYCKTHEKRAHMKDTWYRCDICDYKHHNKNCLRSHMIVHGGEKLHKCNYCGKAFTRTVTLKVHKRIHTGERFKCDCCDRSFIQKSKMKLHMKTQHKDVVFD